MKRYHGDFCYLTDIGNKRLTNEDKALILSNSKGNVLMVVCDGIGGHRRGDVASSLAMRLLEKAFQKKERFLTLRGAKHWLEKTIRDINETIYNEEKDVPYNEHMGTTLVACLLLGSHIIFVNVGDSRAYTLRSNASGSVYDFEQVTTDDTIADYLVNIGRITKEEREQYTSRHVLTNAMGLFPSVRLEMKVLSFKEKKASKKENDEYSISHILLCSDGLFSMVGKEEMISALLADEDTENKVETLITLAKNNGGDDNMAVGLWEATHA